MAARQLSTKVSPRSRANIQKLAQNVRDSMGISSHELPILNICEALQHIDELDLEIVEDHCLPDDEAKTYPDLKIIQVRQSVYDAAYEGDARSRFTMAHELGHYFMHRNQPSAFGRSTNHKIYCDCEWQADRFASEFLIDRRLITSHWCVTDVMDTFSVSLSAAEIALSDIKKEEGNG